MCGFGALDITLAEWHRSRICFFVDPMFFSGCASENCSKFGAWIASVPLPNGQLTPSEQIPKVGLEISKGSQR